MKFSLQRFWWLYISVIFMMIGCDNINIYEKHVPIAKQTWYRDQVCSGSFQVTDTLSAHQLFLIVRHTDAYAYNNIWLEVSLQAPGDTFRMQRVQVPLGNDLQGWLGTGMDDIWESRSLISGLPKSFPRVGTYQFKIRHIMRDDPLKHVMGVGLRVQ